MLRRLNSALASYGLQYGLPAIRCDDLINMAKRMPGVEIGKFATTSELFDPKAGIFRTSLMHQVLSGIIRAFDLIDRGY